MNKEVKYEMRYQTAADTLDRICKERGYDLAVIRHRLNDDNRDAVKTVARLLFAGGFPKDLILDILHKSKKSIEDMLRGED